jgi:hypothetical protein
VCVGAGSEARIGVAEVLGDLVECAALVQEQGGAGVAQVGSRDAGALERGDPDAPSPVLPARLRRLGRALDELDARGPDRRPVDAAGLDSPEPIEARTRAGQVRIVPTPWGTRGYDDLRLRSFRENLGRGARRAIASVVDCVRMLEASDRERDSERLERLRRLMELERQRVQQRRLPIER